MAALGKVGIWRDCWLGGGLGLGGELRFWDLEGGDGCAAGLVLFSRGTGAAHASPMGDSSVPYVALFLLFFLALLDIEWLGFLGHGGGGTKGEGQELYLARPAQAVGWSGFSFRRFLFFSFSSWM